VVCVSPSDEEKTGGMVDSIAKKRKIEAPKTVRTGITWQLMSREMGSLSSSGFAHSIKRQQRKGAFEAGGLKSLSR
jgi:hypothetical protein